MSGFGSQYQQVQQSFGDAQQQIRTLLTAHRATLDWLEQEELDGGRNHEHEAGIRRKYIDWRVGYDLLSLLVNHLREQDRIEMDLGHSWIRIVLNPSVSKSGRSFLGALFDHKTFEVLRSFNHCLARWDTITSLVLQLQYRYPEHAYLKHVLSYNHSHLDDGIARARWEEPIPGLLPFSTTGEEISTISRRRWTFVHCLLLSTWSQDNKSSTVPLAVLQAIRAFHSNSQSHHNYAQGSTQTGHQFIPSRRWSDARDGQPPGWW
ncbi:hypothetical protein JCM3765_007913 [Sporobolomyces pararoseus]